MAGHSALSTTRRYIESDGYGSEACGGVGVMRKKIIYDFGANNGDDIPYYLNKADLVVAVEADPSLCKIMNDRFQNEILSKRLVIENIVIAVDQEAEVPFFIHKTSNVLNQFPEPS